MQAAVWDRLLRLKTDFFRQYTIGDLDSRVTGISQIRSKLTGSTLQTLLTSFFALLNFGLMLAYSSQLALVAGLVAGVAIAFIAAAGTLLLRLTRPSLETRSDDGGFCRRYRAMPMSMYTFVSEGGGNISGGQRQRLMIARALALKPKIILFDEATSALDNRTQAIVTESLDSFGVTRIVIAHRLSTIRNADRIYVIEAGRVVQQGSFETLAGEEGIFAQLIARQLGNSTIAAIIQ
jgi:ABC-type bacteriocin/lantibiotic exporter with double-glycine peptidase domain